MADDFFIDPNQVQEPIIEKIKVGEEEFTQEELQKLVGLGKIGAEAESKYKTKIDRVWPNYQKVINEKQTLEQQLEQMRSQVEKSKEAPVDKNAPLTPEQIREEARKQARELGLVTKDEIDSLVRARASEMMQGQKLLDDISVVIDNMKSEGLPETTIEDMISHMQETGIKNPTKAYKDMFEKEWLESQTTKLNSIKQRGMPSINASAAGSKQPAPVRITGNNLEQLVRDAIAGSYE